MTLNSGSCFTDASTGISTVDSLLPIAREEILWWLVLETSLKRLQFNDLFSRKNLSCNYRKISPFFVYAHRTLRNRFVNLWKTAVDDKDENKEREKKKQNETKQFESVKATGSRDLCKRRQRAEGRNVETNFSKEVGCSCFLLLYALRPITTRFVSRIRSLRFCYEKESVCAIRGISGKSMGSSMARVTFRNSRGIKMSVELIRKYNISPTGLGHARPTFDPISNEQVKFEIRSLIIQTGGGGNLKISRTTRRYIYNLTFHSSIGILSTFWTFRPRKILRVEKVSNTDCGKLNRCSDRTNVVG